MKRRFIAGAVCPRCGQLDKLVMYDTSAGERVQECVRCGYRDVLVEPEPPQELVTRVNQPRAGEPALSHEDEVTIVRVLDPGLKRRDH